MDMDGTGRGIGVAHRAEPETPRSRMRRTPATWQGCIFFAVGIALAMLVRFALFDFEGNDYRFFMGPWYDFIANHGVFSAFGRRFSDYSPPYLYLLAVATLLPLKKLYAIKLVSVVFDFVLATGVALTVRERYRERFLPTCAFFITLFAPTVLLNGALWGQNDVIFTSFLVFCVLFLVRGRNGLALLAYGLALAFKAQAVFLFPLLLTLLLVRRLRFKHFLLIPAVYLGLIIPSAIAGRPLWDLLLVYTHQAGEYRHLTMGAPNLYQWLPDNYALFCNAGILFTVFVILAICALVVSTRATVGRDGIVRVAMVSVLVVPFCLPGMHERYFFPADLMAIVFAFYFPRFFLVPLVVCLASVFAYVPFLFGQTVVSPAHLSLFLLAAIVAVVADWVQSLDLPGREDEPEAGGIREGSDHAV
jgi:Gpi18-like mannosyltransferase